MFSDDRRQSPGRLTFTWPIIGRFTLPTAFQWQPISNALPVHFDHYRRAAAGLAADRLPWFCTCQILEVP